MRQREFGLQHKETEERENKGIWKQGEEEQRNRGKGDKRTLKQRQQETMKHKKQGHQHHNGKNIWKKRTLGNIILGNVSVEPGKEQRKKKLRNVETRKVGESNTREQENMETMKQKKRHKEDKDKKTQKLGNKGTMGHRNKKNKKH